MSPEFLAFHVMANQPARSEVTHHTPAIRRNRGRSGTAFSGVKLLDLFRPGIRLPQQLAVALLITERHKFSVFERRQKNRAVLHTRRRHAGWNGNFPQLVGAGGKFKRRFRRFGDAGAIRPAKLRPVGGVGRANCCRNNCENCKQLLFHSSAKCVNALSGRKPELSDKISRKPMPAQTASFPPWQSRVAPSATRSVLCARSQWIRQESARLPAERGNRWSSPLPRSPHRIGLCAGSFAPWPVRLKQHRQFSPS